MLSTRFILPYFLNNRVENIKLLIKQKTTFSNFGLLDEILG